MRAFRLAAPLLLLPACVIPLGGAEVGDVRVTWSFDGSQRCAEVGVENVTIQLIEKGKEGSEDAKAFGQTAECIAGSMVLLDVVAGTYVMTAVGTGEVAVFNNGEGATIEVVPGQLNDAAAPLTLANGEVVSRIEFQAKFGGEALCSVAGVDAIDAQVIDKNGLAIAGSNTACINGLVAVEGIRVGEHELVVEGVDGNGLVRFAKTVPLKGLQAGETLRIDPIDLSPVIATASVRFTFGEQQLCSEAGVDTIDAQLLDEAGVVVQGQTIDCVAGVVIFTDVPTTLDDALPYTLHVDAIDGNNEVQYTKEFTDIVLDRAVVDLGVKDLAALSSRVRVRFQLPDGVSCAEAGVANMDVQIFERVNNAPGDVLAGTNVACVNGDSGEIVGPAPGPVIVRVQGIGGDVVIVDGSRNATIDAGENIISVPLEAVRTRLELTWSFATVVVDNVATATPERTEITSRCAEADVDTINVRVLQGTQLLQSVSVACSEGRVEIPAIPIRDADGDLLNLKLELEGTREQEGDSIFFGRDEDDADDVPDVNADNVDLRPTGVVSRSDIVLSPSIAFARIIWTEDCGVTQSANVDIQIASDGVSEGINVPCAEGNTLVALPPGTERVRVTLRGVNVQGDQFTAPDVIDNILVIPGVNTFRITGPG